MKHFFLALLALTAIGATPLMAAEKNPVVVMETSQGTIKIELFLDKAPITANNFLSYVDEKFFDDLIFHRVILGFMIQGGGFKAGQANLTEKKGKAPIKNESTNGLSNKRGTIAMARTPDPNSASSQFFINHKDNGPLDRANSGDGFGYCVFGQVIEGMDVVDKIAAVRTGRKADTRGTNHGDVPQNEVVIKSVRRAESK